MCITSTARRRSLTLQVLPSHLLTTSSAAASAEQPRAAAETRPTLLSTKHPILPTKLNKRPNKPLSQLSSSVHHLPHHDGLVVQHHYHDHAADPVVDPSLIKHKAKGGVIVPFPVKLHDMLDKIEADGLANVVSWQPHGRCFVVHKPKEFVNHVMPHYFKQTKMASFQRQLNLYGFNRLTGGLDKGGYYHEMFLRGKVSLSYDIHRMRVKGTGVRLPTNPDNEPNFYALMPVTNMDADPMAVPPLPAPKVSSSDASLAFVNMAHRRAELLRESHNHSRKIAEAKQRLHQQSESDVVFFEGLPFHYLDPSALPSNKPAASAKKPQQQQLPVAEETSSKPRPALAHSSSTVVSESDSDNDNNTFLPSFSPSKMDWDGPLSCPTLQAHMRRSSFQSFAKDGALVDSRPLEEDIESFFQGFEMPVDLYHEQIENMEEDDDTAFGYLLEQAISE
ncbi:hypothetical protein ACHAXR_010850 [Thalassiosira sp. AJA248-18]